MAKKLEEIKEKECPYELPEGWKWERLGSQISLYRGVSYKKDDAHNIKDDNNCLIMRGGNIGEGYIILDTDNVYVDKSLVSENQLIRKNDITTYSNVNPTASYNVPNSYVIVGKDSLGVSEISGLKLTLNSSDYSITLSK